MPVLLSFAGFLGAWLLVAGPLYQASVELREQAVDQEAVHRVADSIRSPPRVSPWWWLLPPVAFIKQQRAGRRFREAVTRAMTPGVLQQLVRFNQKATGWLLVGAGGSLLALTETWGLVEALHWATWSFWPLVIGAFVLSALHTVVQSHRAQAVLESAEQRAEVPADQPGEAGVRGAV